ISNPIVFGSAQAFLGDLPITLSGPLTVQGTLYSVVSGTLTILGDMSGAPLGIFTEGLNPGPVVFTGSKSYHGSIGVQQGVAIIGDDLALGPPSASNGMVSCDGISALARGTSQRGQIQLQG